ncbi:MAG: hypothetical protein HY062_06115 [Bacteroidetes bacterium]|nr:hypothetical protein [Bacteroidota bacterium]
MKALFIFTFCIFFGEICFAQSDTAKYNPKQEIVYDGKRYRVHNNWLSVGAGAGYNTKWPKDEKNLAADFSFHIKLHYFRLGAFMSGSDFNAANNYSFHLCYGLRKEKEKYNLSAFIGPSTSYFRRPLSDSSNYNLTTVYNMLGGYAAIEAVYKIKYDVGIGGQIFCDYNQVQMVYGVRLIAYFSSAYRGIKYGYHAPAKKK